MSSLGQEPTFYRWQICCLLLLILNPGATLSERMLFANAADSVLGSFNCKLSANKELASFLVMYIFVSSPHYCLI